MSGLATGSTGATPNPSLLDPLDSDPNELADQFSPAGQSDRGMVVGGASHPAGMAGNRHFDQHPQLTAQKSPKAPIPQHLAQFTQFHRSTLGDPFRHLPRHDGGWRALPRAEPEDVNLGEPHFLHHAARGREIRLRLARKAHDHVGRQGHRVQVRPESRGNARRTAAPTNGGSSARAPRRRRFAGGRAGAGKSVRGARPSAGSTPA